MKIIVDNITCKCIIGGFDNTKCNVYNELRHYLRVRPANYGQMLMQMRRRGNHGWDGYTYFINVKGVFATGFLPMVLNYLKELGVSVTLEDKRDNVPNFIITPDFETPQGTLAEHQQLLITKSNNYISSYEKTHTWNLYFPRGGWNAATNARKTAAAGNLIKNIENPRAIMLVDDQGLLQQHLKYYRTVFTGLDDVGYITSKEIKLGNILTLAMVRTMYNRLHKDMTMQRNMHSRFNILLVDEGHGFTSREGVFVINKINAGVRIVMSGTLFDQSDKVAKFRLIGMFGNVLHEVSKRYLMDNGFSLIPKIYIYHNPTPTKAWSYDQEFADVITQSEIRAELIADLICKYRNRKVLITFFERKHGEFMYETFIRRYPTLAYLASWVHGEHADREDRVQAFINNTTPILFASTILQQGYNIPDIEVGINAQGEKSAISVSQWGGRLERLDGDKKYFTWVDFYDGFTGNKYCAKHSRKRIQLYKKEDYPVPITFMYPNKKGFPLIK